MLGLGTTATWCLILLMPRRWRHRIIDEAIRATPGFVQMSETDQDQAIALYVWNRR